MVLKINVSAPNMHQAGGEPFLNYNILKHNLKSQ